MISHSNVEVSRTENESNASLIRRFGKRMQESGLLKHARTQRYSERPESKYKKKLRALKRIAKRKEIERLKKLGRL